ncbi:DUF4126 family protein [Spirosoma jeollabukense]
MILNDIIMIRTYLKAFQIGVVAGMRTMTAPALVSYKLSRTTPNPLPDSKLHFLTSPKATNVLAVMAAGELVGDKLPQAGDRIGFPQILGRIGAGAMCGAAIVESEEKSTTYGAVLGALGATAGSFAFFYLRQWLTHEKDLPDPMVALAEDALAIGAGLLIVNDGELWKTAS